MTRIDRFLLRWIFRRAIGVGARHSANAVYIFSLWRECWKDVFTEENEFTSDAILRELFEATQFEDKS